jgi:hypothetical protein
LKRREFIASSASAAGLLVPGVGRTAVPCPPPQVTAVGGTSASTNCAAAKTYSTDFSGTENPLSEGGVWTNGGVTGGDWQNVRKSNGTAYGVGTSAGYNDCIACLPNLAGSTHFVQAAVVKRSGYTPPSSHECELLLGFSIASRVARGYEIDIWFNGTIQAVRWNGPVGDFTVSGGSGWPNLGTGSGFAGGLRDGDILKAVFDSTAGSPRITVYQNGAQVFQIVDTSSGKIMSGGPGIGFFARDGAGLDMTAYCFSSLTAGNG